MGDLEAKVVVILLSIPSFAQGQSLVPLAEAPTMPCQCRHGQFFNSSFGRAINGKWYPPYAPYPCPDCDAGDVPLDLSGQRIAIAVPCSECAGITRYYDDGFVCRSCENKHYMIVASAHVDAVVPVVRWDDMTYDTMSTVDCESDGKLTFYPPNYMLDVNVHERDITDQLAYATFTAGDHALILSDVQPTSDPAVGLT